MRGREEWRIKDELARLETEIKEDMTHPPEASSAKANAAVQRGSGNAQFNRCRIQLLASGQRTRRVAEQRVEAGQRLRRSMLYRASLVIALMGCITYFAAIHLLAGSVAPKMLGLGLLFLALEVSNLAENA